MGRRLTPPFPFLQMLALSVVVVSATEDPASNQMSEVPPPEEEFLEVAPLPPTRPRRGLHLPTLRNPEMFLIISKKFDQIFAYSDSIHDLPLLEFSDFPFVVSPDSKLRAIAKERSWFIDDRRAI